MGPGGDGNSLRILSDRDRFNASWLIEAVAVLAWSIGKFEMPDVDEQCDPAAAADALGFLKPEMETALRSPQFREPDEVKDYFEFIYNLHWRVRDFSLFKKPYDFEALARKAWGEPVLRYGLAIEENDIGIGGIALHKASVHALPPVRQHHTRETSRLKLVDWV